MAWTNKNTSKILIRSLTTSGQWYRLSDKNLTDGANAPTECSEVIIHARNGEPVQIAVGFGSDADAGGNDGPSGVFWTIQKTETLGSAQESFRVTGITNTAQISASAPSDNSVVLEALCRNYNAHIQTG